MKAVLVFVSLVLAVSVAHAQTPEEVSRSYFDLLKGAKWGEVAALYDPSALREFKEMMSFLLELPEEVEPAVLAEFFGPGTTETTVRAMSDATFFSLFLQSVMAQAEVGQLDFKKIEVLGSVPEGEEVRHVVTRTHVGLGKMTMEAMEVISFRKTEGGWKILMQGKMKGLAQQIREALSPD